MNEPTLTLYPELIQDVILYILCAVLLCGAARILHDWRESRRLKKEFAAWQQSREEDRT